MGSVRGGVDLQVKLDVKHPSLAMRCKGRRRVHNPKVGSSSLPRAIPLFRSAPDGASVFGPSSWFNVDQPGSKCFHVERLDVKGLHM